MLARVLLDCQTWLRCGPFIVFVYDYLTCACRLPRRSHRTACGDTRTGLPAPRLRRLLQLTCRVHGMVRWGGYCQLWPETSGVWGHPHLVRQQEHLGSFPHTQWLIEHDAAFVDWLPAHGMPIIPHVSHVCCQAQTATHSDAIPHHTLVTRARQVLAPRRPARHLRPRGGPAAVPQARHHGAAVHRAAGAAAGS